MIQTLDIDPFIEIMYAHSYYLVSRIEDAVCSVIPTHGEASEWIEVEKAGAVTLIEVKTEPKRTGRTCGSYRFLVDERISLGKF